MITFYCYPEYDPKRGYTRREMRDLILPHRELLTLAIARETYHSPEAVDSYTPNGLELNF